MTTAAPSREEKVKQLEIEVGRISLAGNLVLPATADSLVIFSHGSGSSRFSPRNNFVAQQLQRKNIGTFLVDLLTPEEDAVYSTRFDIELLTERLMEITRWLHQTQGKDLKLGYFGASTGAASALRAAALLPRLIKAVVSRGGRPDLARDLLGKVGAPTLLIVGAMDFDVLRLNREAYERLDCEKKLSIVPNATHLFEEPGALEQVSMLAAAWFEEHLSNMDSPNS